MKTYKKAFTLVEVIITLTILALIFTSVMSVFLFYSSLGGKVETNRLLQSNIKSIVEHITEDIRDQSIDVSYYSYIASPNGLHAKEDEVLYVGNNEYYLAIVPDGYDGTSPLSRVDQDTCLVVENNCTLIKKVSGEYIPISNSWVSFKNLNFYISSDEYEMSKVTMVFEMNAAAGKGFKTSLLESSSINMQVTITEKILDKL